MVQNDTTLGHLYFTGLYCYSYNLKLMGASAPIPPRQYLVYRMVYRMVQNDTIFIDDVM